MHCLIVLENQLNAVFQQKLYNEANEKQRAYADFFLFHAPFTVKTIAGKNILYCIGEGSWAVICTLVIEVSDISPPILHFRYKRTDDGWRTFSYDNSRTTKSLHTHKLLHENKFVTTPPLQCHKRTFYCGTWLEVSTSFPLFSHCVSIHNFY